MLRRENEASLLACRDARASPAEGRVAAQTHFDENERLPIAANKIDFAATATEIARQDN